MRLWLFALPVAMLAVASHARDVKMTVTSKDYRASAARIGRCDARVRIGKEKDGLVPLTIRAKTGDSGAAVDCVLEALFWGAAPEVFAGNARLTPTHDLAKVETEAAKP